MVPCAVSSHARALIFPICELVASSVGRWCSTICLTCGSERCNNTSASCVLFATHARALGKSVEITPSSNADFSRHAQHTSCAAVGHFRQLT
eukprot:3096194-Rhodomonas_salina.3